MNANKKHSEKISFYVTPAVYKAISAASEEAKRRMSDWCQMVIEQELEKAKNGAADVGPNDVRSNSIPIQKGLSRAM